MTRTAGIAFIVIFIPMIAGAAPAPSFAPPAPAHNAWHVCWMDPCDAALQPAAWTVRFALPANLPSPAMDGSAQRPRPIAIEYSHGYQVRRKIHKYASFATLPLFGTELLLGESLYNRTPADRGDARKGLHAFIGTSIVGLFGVNTVTGAWNLFGEGRKDPHGRTLRLIHGLLMMAADAGFVATTMSGPNSRRFSEALTYEADKATHRNLAIASIGVGTAGYLLMLIGNR